VKNLTQQCVTAIVVLGCIFAAGCAGHGEKKMTDSASMDANGTTTFTRVVPMPATISKEAQDWLANLGRQPYGPPQHLAERREFTDEWRATASAEARKLFPVNIEQKTIGGVPTDVITPLEMPAGNKDCVLINLHGGGFNSDSGSQIEGVPIANLAKMKVVGVYYLLAPEDPFPTQVNEVVEVYKELLKDHKPEKIGIFGTSAGGILTAEVTVKLKQLGLPMPGALGLFSILADFSKPADSQSFFALGGLPGVVTPQDPGKKLSDEYAPNTDPKDPVLSPIYADLHGMPPSLLVTGTRDSLLSNTSLFHRALLKAGNDSQLVVYEAMPHAFWYHFQLPETRETLELMAKFFDDKLAGAKSDGKTSAKATK
jgi:epsilon-lactone hydrolase